MDIGFWVFNIYFIVFITSFFISIKAIVKKNYEALSWNIILMFGCFLGLCAGWPVWARYYSGLYNITWNG